MVRNSVCNRNVDKWCGVLLLIALCALPACAAQQLSAASSANNGEAIIEKRKIVLVRRGKIARDFLERKRAVISYPVITGLENPAALNKVRSAIRLKNIFDYSLAEYKEDAWLTRFDYKVNYNKNYILDLTFKQEGVGAYPDEQTKHFAFNLKSGDVIKADDVFKQTSLEHLARLVNDRLQAEVRQIITEQRAFH